MKTQDRELNQFNAVGITGYIGESSSYFTFLVNPESIAIIENALKDENTPPKRKNQFLELVFILHLIRYRSNIKSLSIGNDIDKFITQNWVDKDYLTSYLVGLGLISVGEAIRNRRTTPYYLEGVAKEEGFYSIPSGVCGAWLNKCIIEKHFNKAKKYNNWENVTLDSSFDIDSLKNSILNNPDKKEKDKASQIEAIDNFIEGEIFAFKKTNNEKRLYTTFNSIPSILRKNLLSNKGNKMPEIDIKASQPRLFSKAMLKALDYIESKANFTFDYMVMNNEIAGLCPQFQDLGYVELFKLIRQELNEFEEIAAVDIYSHFSKLTGLDRDSSKKVFLAIFNDAFGDVKAKQYKKALEVFSIHFPLINVFIHYLHKLTRKYKGNVEQAKYNVWAMLGSFESELILDKVCKPFILAKPNESIITAHDSILVDPSNIEDILIRLIEVYKSEKIKLLVDIEGLTSFNDLDQYKEYIFNYNDLIKDTFKDTLKELKREREREEIDIYHLSGIFSPLSRAKPVQVKPYRNGFRASVKNKDIYSRKGETLQEFKQRLNDLGAILSF